MADVIPAPSAGAGGMLVVAGPTELARCPTTLPDTTEGWCMRLNAIGPSDLNLDEKGEVILELAHVFVHWRDDIDDGRGGKRAASWLVLIDTDGRTFGTSSPYVAHRVARLLREVQAGHINLPQVVRIFRQRNRKDSATYMDMKVV